MKKILIIAILGLITVGIVRYYVDDSLIEETEEVFGVGTIVHDSTTTDAETYEDPKEWSHTCTGSNLLLIIGISADGEHPAGVTYNGTSMTLAVSASSVGNEYASIWYLINPSTGSNIVSVDYSGAVYSIGVSSSYTGVLQTSPLDDSASSTGDSQGGDSITLTTAVANELLYDLLSIETVWDPTPSPSTGQTSRLSLDGSIYSDAESSEKIISGAAGNYSMGYDAWNGSFTSEFAHVAVGFKPAEEAATGDSVPNIIIFD